MIRRRLGLAVLILWAPALVVVIGLLMVEHLAPMPPPGDVDTLRAGLRQRGEDDEHRVVHVIYEPCSCTRRLWAHLLERGPRPDLTEIILYVGDEGPRVEAARAAGFRAHVLGREALRRQFALDAAPVLAVLAGDRVDYLGGYYDSPAAVHPRDREVIEASRAGRPPRGKPVFGCAVDEALAQRRDPLGLRRWTRRR